MIKIVLILLFLVSGAYAHVEDGDALQLRSYYAITSQPAPIDADIAGTNPTKWKNAYVRSIKFDGPNSDVREATLLITDDGQFLYVAVAAKIQDSGANNFCRLYFDQNHNHSMDVSTFTSQGEYYVEAKSGGSYNGGWNGSSWYEYSSIPAGLETAVDTKGSGATQTWNFEFKIPLSGGTSGSGECYLNVNPGDEIGLFIHIFVSSDKHIYWTDTNMEVSNNEPINPAGWGDLQLGVEAPLRTVYAPIAMGHEPAIDGYVINDSTWSHYTTQSRNIVLTNYTGSKINATIYAKTGAADVFLGLVISTVPVVGDYMTAFLDYDDGAGDDVDYELTDNCENGITINYTGVSTGTFSDKYFNIGPEWAEDAKDGEGAVRHNGTSYEWECSIPLKGTGSFDLQVSTGALLGLNIKVLLNGSTFWWYAGTNSEWQQIRLDNNVYTSLGWGFLQTGAPVVQPIFPKDGEEVSGHYPFMVYATGAGGVGEITSVNVEYTISGSTTTLVLERADEDGYWTKTWDTTVISYESNLELRITATNSSGVETKAVIEVTIDNTGGATGNEPVVEITVPVAGALLKGTTRVYFNAQPEGGTLDDVEITIDGYVVDESSWVNVNSYNSGGGSGYYDWNTVVYPDGTSMSDGEHIIQIRAHDTENLWGYSATRLVYIDNNGPEISKLSVEYPSGQTMAKKGDIILISAEVTDSIAGVNNATVKLDSDNLDFSTHTLVDSGASGDKVSGDSVYSYEITVATTSGGSISFSIDASDNLGNDATTLQGNVVLDNTVPVVSINPVISPTKYPNQVITGNYTEANIDSIKVNGVPAQVFTSSYVASVTLVEGTNSIYVVAEDKAGNVGMASTSVTYDPNAPITIIRPDPDSYLKGTVTIEVNSSADITTEVHFQFSPDGGTNWYNLSGGAGSTNDTDKSDGWQQNWNTTADGLSDGSNYQIRVIAYDEQGNQIASDTIDGLTVDNTDPVVSINTVVSPTKFPNQTITGSFTEDNLAQLLVNGIEALISGTNYSATVPLIEGSNTITVYIEDKAGNTATSTTSIFYDPNSPISIIRPVSDSQVNGTTVIEVIARDITQEVWFEVSPDNGITWYNLSRTLEKKTTDFTYLDGWKQDWNTSLFSDSTNYQVRVYSYSSEAATPTISATASGITVDNTAPVINFSTASFSPLPKIVGATYYIYVDQIRIDFSAVDATAGMGSVKITSRNDNGDRVYYADVNPADDGEVIQYLPLVEGKNEISVKAADTLGNESAEQIITVYYTEPKQSAVIGSSGGTVQSPDETKVIIPAGALLEDTKITITVVDEAELPKPVNASVSLIGIARDFGPSGLVFNEPVELTIPYAEADLDKNLDGTADFDENKLEIYFWDGDDWIKVGYKERDTAKNLISVEVNHFTIFALGEDTSAVPEKVKVFLTNNPFKTGTGTTFVYDLPKDAKVKISIYDLSGDRVVEFPEISQLAGRRSHFWKGDNEFGHYVGSGIYVYVFEADFSDGSKEIKKELIGVIK